MSYAAVAASGPRQSPEELSAEDCTKIILSRAPAPPVVERTEDTHTSSLIDVDSPHVISVASDYDGSTTTQQDREAREAEREYREFERKAEAEAKKFESKIRKGEKKLAENKDNPVVIGNATLLAIGTLALGWGAYYKHSRNELTGKLVGFWAAGLTLFAVGDFYTSQWLFKNKYPTK